MASFGTPLTRMRWASWPWLWPWLAPSRVDRSDETFNSVAFGCISLHSLSRTLILAFSHGEKGFEPSRERRLGLSVL